MSAISERDEKNPPLDFILVYLNLITLKLLEGILSAVS